MKIVCEKTGVVIRIDKADGDKGRINSVKVYDADNTLQVVTNIYLDGNEIETIKK